MTNTTLSNSQAENLFNLAKVSVSRFVHKNYSKYFNKLDIEDIVSDTVLKALRYQASFNPEKASYNTWVSRIARNVVLDALDYKFKRNDINGDMYPMYAGKDNGVDLSQVVGDVDTDRRILTDDFMESIRERESILSTRDRSIWEMLKDGLKPREIAEITGMSANAVSIRKYYILRTLWPETAGLSREYGLNIKNVAC